MRSFVPPSFRRTAGDGNLDSLTSANASFAPSAPRVEVVRGPGKGDAAPDFELLDQRGDTVRLRDYRGRKLLVYFYPEADTPGCTVQSCDLRDHRQDLAQIGLDVVGISPDAPAKQLAFDQRYHLGFPLLSDEDHAVATAWGTWVEKHRGGHTYFGILRSSFLVDEEGRIEEAWSPVTPEDTVPNALAAVAA
jgi:peroxiredoxin Q/BCP